ncbi:MAG TPA: addiction module protein [Phycisphaerae bacterium]|nr:addiction module protein [Phycisphaerae bacterium]
MGDVLALNPAERILLVEAIYNSVLELPHGVELSEAQRRELGSRLDELHCDPGAGFLWDFVKTRMPYNA